MKKILFFVIVSLFSSILHAQTIDISETELKTQLDSVLAEGLLLYGYERAAWISTDLAMENPTVKQNFWSYLVYEDQNEIRVIIIGKKAQNCIAEYSFKNDFNNPKSIKIENRELSDKENFLLGLREKILINVSDEKYGITIPDGYNLNFILLPFTDKYKFYIITGTSKDDTIPFGNDYLFIADKNGEIEDWQKFHSRLIPAQTKVDGGKVNRLVHSHLRTTPLMTATDICTFMLYAPLYDIDTFSVYSPAIGKYMTYSLKDNEIIVNQDTDH